MINYIDSSKGGTRDARPQSNFFYFYALFGKNLTGWRLHLGNPGSATELDHSDLRAVQVPMHITLNMFSSIFSRALHNLTTLNLQCSVPFHHLVFEALSNVINLRKTKGFQRYPVTFNQLQPHFFIFISLH